MWNKLIHLHQCYLLRSEDYVKNGFRCFFLGGRVITRFINMCIKRAAFRAPFCVEKWIKFEGNRINSPFWNRNSSLAKRSRDKWETLIEDLKKKKIHVPCRGSQCHMASARVDTREVDHVGFAAASLLLEHMTRAAHKWRKETIDQPTTAAASGALP